MRRSSNLKLKSKKSKAKSNENDGIKSNGRVALIGFFGGLIWGLVGYVGYLLNFSKIGPSIILDPWVLDSWKNKAGGQFISIFILCILSVLFALIYKVTMGKVESIWMGIGSGWILWVIIFYILEPWMPKVPSVTELGVNTLTTTLCLFTLYGLFIGYSIAFEMESDSDGSDSGNYSNP